MPRPVCLSYNHFHKGRKRNFLTELCSQAYITNYKIVTFAYFRVIVVDLPKQSKKEQKKNLLNHCFVGFCCFVSNCSFVEVVSRGASLEKSWFRNVVLIRDFSRISTRKSRKTGKYVNFN